MWNPVLVSVDHVPSLPVDTSALEMATVALERDAANMEARANDLVKQWRRLADAYQTGHTDRAIMSMWPVPSSTAAVRDAVWEIAWVLRRFADEITARKSERRMLASRIRAFTRQPWVSEKILLPFSDEFNQNIALSRQVAVLRHRIRTAEQRCAASLEGIQLDPREADPYADLTSISRNTNLIAFWNRRDVVAQNFDAPLFGESGVISGSQVSQGDLGNCWFLASLAAIADADPGAIERMVRQNPDGTYSVSMYLDGAWQSVEVDNTMLVADDGRPVFSGSKTNDDNALWPMIVEKAAVKALDGEYSALVAGTGAKAMEMFTGNPAKNDFFAPNHILDPNAIANYAAASERPGTVMTANSKISLVGSETISAKSTENDGEVVEVKFSNNHVYQVKSIDPAGNVTLVNPHNNYGVSDGYDADEFILTAAQFRDHFVGLSVGSTR